MLRGQLAYLPFGSRQSGGQISAPLAVAVLFDRVYTDDNAIKSEGDKADQFGGGILGRLGSMRLSTVAFKRRHQHRQGGRTDLLVGLVTEASYAHVIDTNSRLYLEAEGALIQGHSTLSQSVLEPEAVDVYAAGTIIRLGAESRNIDGVFEFGYASGDDNIFDREAHNFRFDTGYRVGAFLFSFLSSRNHSCIGIKRHRRDLSRRSSSWLRTACYPRRNRKRNVPEWALRSPITQFVIARYEYLARHDCGAMGGSVSQFTQWRNPHGS